MGRIFKAVRILVAGIFLCGVMLIGGKVSAAEVDDESAMQIFRETILQTSNLDERVFHQDIFFVVPRFIGELEFLGATEKDSLKLAGTLEFWAVDDDGNDNYVDNPFYLVQDKENMTLYFQDEKNWKKMTSSVAAANLLDKFTTPNAQELDEMISLTKGVKVLSDGENYRTLLVKLDCGKFVDAIKADLANDPEFQKQATDPMTAAILECIETGVRNADVWYTWTVNKATWRTDTMSFNLSGLVQSVATAALQNPATGAIPEIRTLLETAAFYSEFKAYVAFLNPAAKSKLEIPKKVLKAKEVEGVGNSKK